MKTSIARHRTMALCVAALLLSFGPLRAKAAFDAFVKFGNSSGANLHYVGESVDKQFPGNQGWSELREFSNGILNTVEVGSASGGAGAGKASFEDFHFAKNVDSGSAILFKVCAVGDHFNEIELVLRNTGGTRDSSAPFYSAKMRQVGVKKIEWSAAEDDANPDENVTIVFGAIQWTYTQTLANGSTKSTTVNWDIINNKGGVGPLPGGTAGTPVLASLTPSTITANGSEFTLKVNGSSFANGATVNLNGTPRVTTFVDSTQLTATIPASDLVSQEPVRTAAITVVNPGGAASGKLLLSIVASVSTRSDSVIVDPGNDGEVDTTPQGSGQSGLKAFLSNSSGNQPISLGVVNFEQNPISGGTVFGVGSTFVDLQVQGANANSTLSASFYYSDTIVGTAEIKLSLLYFNGSSWQQVRTSGGGLPAKNTTDNLDQTVSGGRFSVIFDATSTPKITELSGTVFTMALDSTPPQVTAPAPVIVSTGASATSCTRFFSDTDLGTATAVDDFPGEISINRTGVPLGNLFPVGETIVTYTATDAAGNSSQATQSVIVLDNTPPLITAPATVTLKTGAGSVSCERLVSDAELGAANASDNCSVTVTRSGVPADNIFPIGSTTITYTARDPAGNTATATQVVTIIDDSVPVISDISVTPDSLWPPNHKLVMVTVNYKATDNCGPAISSISATSSDPDKNPRDKDDSSGDIQLIDAHHLWLRAERWQGDANGRTYTITISSKDESGNSTSTSVTVKVPRDERPAK